MSAANCFVAGREPHDVRVPWRANPQMNTRDTAWRRRAARLCASHENMDADFPRAL